jgi:hypothetical protein
VLPVNASAITHHATFMGIRLRARRRVHPRRSPQQDRIEGHLPDRHVQLDCGRSKVCMSCITWRMT